jgi:hypothetical protein
MSTLNPVSPASTALAPVSSHRLPDTDVPSDFDVMMRMAEQLASADKFLPDELAGKPGNVLALMLRARALNVPFAVACDELYIQRKGGKISQSARLVRALARRAGHRFYTLESDSNHCVLLVQLAGEKSPRRVEFTMQDAHRMGLTNPEGNNKGGQWDKQPANMLYARCTTRAVTRYCPEVILGMGSDFLNEEMPDDQDGSLREPDDVIAAFREEDRKLVEQVLLAAQDTDHLDDGKEREEILLKLGMQYGQVLNYAAGEDTDLTVRQVLLARLRSAKERGDKQAKGEEVPPAKPFPVPGDAPAKGAPAGEKVPAQGDGATRARKAAGGRTGARARAAEDKAARTTGEGVVGAEVVQDKAPAVKGASREEVFARVLEGGGTWDRRRFGGLYAEMTDHSITGDRAAMLLKELHQAHPDRVSHKPGTRYTVTVNAPVKAKKPAPSGLRPKATTPPPTQEPTPAKATEVMADQARPVADDKILACGCPAEQVLFEGVHVKGCTEAGS